MGKNWIVTKVNQNYILRSGMKKFKCQVGASGLKIHSKKREGDKATPIGKWKLKSIYYRSDKIVKSIIKPKTLKLNKITKNILIKYGECIRKQFIVKTLDGGIIFRRWNDINFYKKPSNNIVDIIDNKAISNLKIVYNNEDYYLIDLEA